MLSFGMPYKDPELRRAYQTEHKRRKRLDPAYKGRDNETARRSYHKRVEVCQARARRYGREHREERRVYEKAWRARNPDKVQKTREKHNHKVLGWLLHREYGISSGEYEALRESQGGVCAVCRTFAPTKQHPRLSVDHDHRTKRVRGLLCSSCNFGIGHLKDDPKLLRSAAEYLRRNEKG